MSVRRNTWKEHREEQVMRKVRELYAIDQALDMGNRRHIYAGRDRSNEKPVIVKILIGEICRGNFNREVLALRLLKGDRGIVKLHNVHELPELQSMLLVTERDNKFVDLFQLLTNWGRGFCEYEAMGIFRGVVDIVRDLDYSSIFHGDIKDENVLYNREDGRVKMLGFGKSQVGSLRRNSVVKDFNYASGYFAPPESMKFGCWTPMGVNAWQLGVFLVGLLTGDYGGGEYDVNNRWRERSTLEFVGKDACKVSQETRDLIDSCLSLDYDERPNLEDVSRMCELYEDSTVIDSD